MKFSIKGFFSKFDQIHRKLRIWSYLLPKSLLDFICSDRKLNSIVKVNMKQIWFLDQNSVIHISLFFILSRICQRETPFP